jgi:Cupredoxin-like domain
LKHLLIITLFFPLNVFAADYMLTIKDHQFQPAEIVIPSGTKVRLLIENQDATPEEFDSYSLNREKVITGHGTATIYIGPLSPGRYPFIGEFHATTAQGVIVAH